MSWLQRVRDYFAQAERPSDLRGVQGAGVAEDVAQPEAVILVDGRQEIAVPVSDEKWHLMTFRGRTWHHVTEREGVWVYQPTR